jgi:hypothetical protein
VSYREFWGRYLCAHADPRTRVLHYIGTLLALAFLGAGLVADRRFLVLAPIAGYGFAWFGHFAIERNRPETFGHPFWSLASDFRMLGLFLSGRLGRELQREAVGARR